MCTIPQVDINAYTAGFSSYVNTQKEGDVAEVKMVCAMSNVAILKHIGHIPL